MNQSQQSSDSWNAKLYDGKHSFVSEYGNDLINFLAPKPNEHILDLGCGTGDISKKLYDHGVNVVGIDKSENMIQRAKSKYPYIKFTVGDATELKYTEEFDAIFSNATLHWVTPPQKALSCIYNSLKDGGRFVAEFGGKGNVLFITNQIKQEMELLGLTYAEERFPWYFPSIGEYSTQMEKEGFEVTFATHFKRPTPLEGENGLRNWINMFGQSMFAGIDEETVSLIITNVEHSLSDTLLEDGVWIADYKRIRVIGVK
ncbi:methyltransferase domain-containing protein [Aquibacillus halophilus]|uniref:Methyltransferase domain-containing protein n=1 Tax=Aquibacillus halophilus TaxID=930132 RepID=A0A6A8DH63_9BACI|nr:class I SAM-dependent methyltransferase [Aquibacillus halophilus]MRH43836.1 methyltransferase domain-containing protein [Aquibacillus halophilus]